MYQLSTYEMQEINGGSALGYIIYVMLGAAAYKIWKSKKGRISLPRLISLEWEN